MSDIFVCAAPAGIDGSGRVRVPVRPWATGGAVHTGARGIELAASLAPFGTTNGHTTNVYTTLGNHSPGRPQS